MEATSGSGSGSSSRMSNHPMCDCGITAKIFKSKTRRNLNRRFFGCELYKEGGGSHCKFFRWLDEEEITGWPKRTLSLAEAKIREKDKAIEQLRRTITELSRDLEKLDAEVEVKKSDEVALKTKLDDLESVVYRQRIIITGMSALFVCSIGAILFG